MQTISSRKVIITSLLVSVSDIVLNLTVTLLTGSAVMLAQALQGASDLSAASLIAVGHYRSNRPANKHFPFGFGKEVYFWTLLSGFTIFAFTATLSFYFGYQAYKHPQPVENIFLAYGMLLFGMTTNFYAFSLSVKRILRGRKLSHLPQVFMTTPLVESKTTFILDLMGTSAALFGFTALVIYRLTGDIRFDGIGAMTVGVVLAVMALIQLSGVRDYVVGRSAPQKILRKIRETARTVDGIVAVLDLKTMLIGTNRFLVLIEVQVKRTLSVRAVEKLTDQVKARVTEEIPEIRHIQVEIETPDDEN